MKKEHLTELAQREADYWWFVNKRRIVLRWLRRYVKPSAHILEVGCGGGYLSAFLTHAGWQLKVADARADAVQLAREHGAQGGMVFDAGGVWPLGDAGLDLDVILMLDLLEHIADDVQCLREAGRVLKPGGIIILTVPAHPTLFSRWDEVLGHQRRYTRCRLEAVSQEAGLNLNRMSYWNAISLVPAFLWRRKNSRLSDQFERAVFPPVGQVMNRLLIGWGYIEAAWLSCLNIPCGLSLAAVLKKPGETP